MCELASKALVKPLSAQLVMTGETSLSDCLRDIKRRLTGNHLNFEVISNLTSGYYED